MDLERNLARFPRTWPPRDATLPAQLFILSYLFAANADEPFAGPAQVPWTAGSQFEPFSPSQLPAALPFAEENAPSQPQSPGIFAWLGSFHGEVQTLPGYYDP